MRICRSPEVCPSHTRVQTPPSQASGANLPEKEYLGASRSLRSCGCPSLVIESPAIAIQKDVPVHKAPEDLTKLKLTMADMINGRSK